MSTLSGEDVERIADVVVERMEQKFWVEPEKHYQEHSAWRVFDPDDIHSLKDLVRAYRGARSVFWKAFLGFAVIGALIASAVGLGFKQ